MGNLETFLCRCVVVVVVVRVFLQKKKGSLTQIKLQIFFSCRGPKKNATMRFSDLSYCCIHSCRPKCAKNAAPCGKVLFSLKQLVSLLSENKKTNEKKPKMYSYHFVLCMRPLYICKSDSGTFNRIFRLFFSSFNFLLVFEDLQKIVRNVSFKNLSFYCTILHAK